MRVCQCVLSSKADLDSRPIPGCNSMHGRVLAAAREEAKQDEETPWDFIHTHT